MVRAVAFAACLLAGVTGSAVAGTVTGDYIEARTCDVYTGHCFANSEMGVAGDQAILAWRVNRGTWEGVDLTGLSVVAAVQGADTLGDEFTNPYPARCVLIVDDRATEEQKTALVSFARAKGGRLLENVVRVDSAPVELTVRCCEKAGCARLVAGKLASIETRCMGNNDHVCGNEDIYYQPLTKLNNDFIPAVTVTHEFKGSGLNGTWSSPGKRSAFIGSFGR